MYEASSLHKNAAILALQLLALKDDTIRATFTAFRAELSNA